ncbi:MAG: alpha/beta hydrolase [Mycobacterium sp.]|nr:alpha/beta hydrolase [Mycobacterium sp.]
MNRPAHLAAVVAVTALLAGCAPGLAANPRYATDVRGNGSDPTPTSQAPEGPAPIAAPAIDLPWRECTSEVFNDAALPAPPSITLDCATYEADLDPIAGATGTVNIGVVRARSVQTPADAGPVVFTTGSDMPTSQQLPVWLSRAGADILNTHPIVAVDRRGMGMSSPVDCRDLFDRQEMRDQAQFEPGDDPVANLGAVTMTATTSCTDTIAPGDSAYDNLHAAEDLEKLRSTWDVPTLALLGIGNGAQVALAYAGAHPDKVSRLVLDSPLPLAVSAEGAAEQQVRGQQAALDAFATQCAAIGCALGPDPKAAVAALISAAADGRGPGGAAVSQLVTAITTALAFPDGDRVTSTTKLADALAAARSGDGNQLTSLMNQAEALRESDGQFVNRCSDALNRPTPDRVRELVVAWDRQYPQFGGVAALNLVKCLNWPSGKAPEDPKDLKTDVLLLGVQNDPIVGGDGVAATAATIINAGAASRRVMWQGIGHGASVYSSCAMAPLLDYLGSGKAPPTDTYCPA